MAGKVVRPEPTADATVSECRQRTAEGCLQPGAESPLQSTVTEASEGNAEIEDSSTRDISRKEDRTKDTVKKRRASKTAKLKQTKFDVRREQFLSQVAAAKTTPKPTSQSHSSRNASSLLGGLEESNQQANSNGPNILLANGSASPVLVTSPSPATSPGSRDLHNPAAAASRSSPTWAGAEAEDEKRGEECNGEQATAASQQKLALENGTANCKVAQARDKKTANTGSCKVSGHQGNDSGCASVCGNANGPVLACKEEGFNGKGESEEGDEWEEQAGLWQQHEFEERKEAACSQVATAAVFIDVIAAVTGPLSQQQASPLLSCQLKREAIAEVASGAEACRVKESICSVEGKGRCERKKSSSSRSRSSSSSSSSAGGDAEGSSSSSGIAAGDGSSSSTNSSSSSGSSNGVQGDELEGPKAGKKKSRKGGREAVEKGQPCESSRADGRAAAAARGFGRCHSEPSHAATPPCNASTGKSGATSPAAAAAVAAASPAAHAASPASVSAAPAAVSATNTPPHAGRAALSFLPSKQHNIGTYSRYQANGIDTNGKAGHGMTGNAGVAGHGMNGKASPAGHGSETDDSDDDDWEAAADSLDTQLKGRKENGRSNAWDAGSEEVGGAWRRGGEAAALAHGKESRREAKLLAAVASWEASEQDVTVTGAGAKEQESCTKLFRSASARARSSAGLQLGSGSPRPSVPLKFSPVFGSSSAGSSSSSGGSTSSHSHLLLSTSTSLPVPSALSLSLGSGGIDFCNGAKIFGGGLRPEYTYNAAGMGGRARCPAAAAAAAAVSERAWRADDSGRVNSPSPGSGLSQQHQQQQQLQSDFFLGHSPAGSTSAWMSNRLFSPGSGGLGGSSLWSENLASSPADGLRNAPDPGSSSTPVCPICAEELDGTDSSFVPCSCGFRLCLFCHHRIASDDGRCPGCRRAYSPDVAARLSQMPNPRLRF